MNLGCNTLLEFEILHSILEHCELSLHVLNQHIKYVLNKLTHIHAV